VTIGRKLLARSLAAAPRVAALSLLPLLVTGAEDSPSSRQDGYVQVPYNGAFTFARIRYGSVSGSRRFGNGAWAHDYPKADLHLPKILRYVSDIPTNTAGSNVFDLDDPEIFRHPLIYLSEPGFWGMTEAEGRGLREYLLKGGFLILDDFENEQWYNMEEQLRRAMPEFQLIEIKADHPIFSSFFELADVYVPHPLVRVTPRYFAMFENNDPGARMLVLVNYNADLAEYWEWSDTGFLPLDLSNEAYKLGVNYVFYGLTH
jgi:hypothetical protein